jgi:hypothetical protein
MMQNIRLETKSRELVREIEMPIFPNGEPDAVVVEGRVFIRRPPFQTEPPKKNAPETYFEAFTWQIGAQAPEPSFARVTETKATEPPAATSRRGATKD